MAANNPFKADNTSPKAKLPDYLILGIGTGEAGPMRAHWDNVWNRMEQTDFTGRQVAIAGLDNQVGYPSGGKDAVGLLADKVRERGGLLLPKKTQNPTA